MPEVPPIWRTVIEAIASGPSAWTTPATLSARLGRDEEETTDVLAALDDAGLVLVREPHDADSPVVTLSPRGAELLRPAPLSRLVGSRDRRPALSGSIA